MATYSWGPVENGTIYQDVPATENTDYVYSMWVSGDGGSAGNYYMKVEWYAGETLLDSNSLDITAVVNSATWVEASLVVNNDGLHGMLEKNGSIYLVLGRHPITVTFFENSGGEDLIVSYAGPGIPKTQIPNDVLYRTTE